MHASRNLLLLCFGLTLLLLGVLFWLYHNPVLGHDQYLLLFDARRFLAGAELYGPRILEANPPFIIWFSVIPVVAADLLHLPETVVFQLITLAMIGASIAWCLRIARRWERLRDPKTLILLAIVLLFVDSPLRILLFGQREHFFFLCVAPYVLTLAFDVARTLSVPERVALGIVAGIGVCFKPQEVLVIVAIAAAMLMLRRSLGLLVSPELLAATLTGVLYVAAISHYAPLYLTQMVPLLRDTYWALGSHSASYLALHQLPEMCGVLLAGLGALFWLKGSRERAAILTLFACWLGASLAYDIQHTDWSYHRYPASAFVLLALGVLAILRSQSFLTVHDGRPSLVLRAGLLMLLLVFLVVEARIPRDARLPGDGGALASLKKGDSAFIFSTGVEMLPVVYRRHLEWGSRFADLWLLPAILKNAPGGRDNAPRDQPFKPLPPATIAKLAALEREDVAEDLDHWKPRVVLVQECPCEFINQQDFRMLEWFSKGAAFARAWSHYEQQPGIGGFNVYVRRD